MLPRVILHIGVSLDGRIDWGTGGDDAGLYYELAARWNAEAMLSGSNTMLAAYSGQETPPEADLDPSGPKELHPLHVPFLVVVDSRGQIRNWRVIQREPFWRDVIVLCSRATPQAYLDDLKKCHLDYIVAGDERVDFRTALEELSARYGITKIRIDSGGILSGVLLRAGLVNEVSVLVGPYLVGGTSPRSMFVAPDLASPDGVIPLRLIAVEQMRGDIIWLRYEVVIREQ
jgi:2,5-diamino-6-(ribosylamino)-4(3H)-pyrimidinone 5'-phosphate reductase